MLPPAWLERQAARLTHAEILQLQENRALMRAQDNPAMAFLTDDDEHHRFAFVDLAVLQPDARDSEKLGLVGVEHVAYTYPSLDDLFANYTRLKASGILPCWCIHHGLTVLMYYADPDGNQLEFQVDCFESTGECNAFIRGPSFSINPVGVEFDPEDWLTQVRSGASFADFLVRRRWPPKLDCAQSTPAGHEECKAKEGCL